VKWLRPRVAQTKVALQMLEPCEGKLSRTVLRGAGSRKAPWPTRSKEMI